VQQSFTLVGLDGITFDTIATDDGWENLLETIPDTQRIPFTTATGFASPGFKLVDNMVYLRGVVERKVTSTEASDFVPVVGVLPQTFRPENLMNYATLSLDGIKLHHVTVSARGQVQVQFDASQQFIALDGIAFARWSGSYGFGNWQFGTDNGDTLQIMSIETGTPCAFQDTQDVLIST